MRELLVRLYHQDFLSRIFRTLVYCLWQELKDCRSVLDLGCGADSPLQYCKNIKYSVGVEVFKPYLEESKKRGIHTKYINKRIEEVDFPDKSFDAVIMIEVLEHLPEKTGLEILKRAERWAVKKIIVSSPNGFIKQKEVDNNPYQKHLSGWSLEKMRRLSFKSYGLAGFKWLRQVRDYDTKEATLISSIRFRPKLFWFIIAVLSQAITYHLPQLAFGLFSMKNLNEKKNKFFSTLLIL